MKKRVVTGLAAVLVVVFVVSGLGLVSFNEHFLFQKELVFTPIQEPGGEVEYYYYGEAKDSETTVAEIFLRVTQEFDNQRRVRFDVQHSGNTELDSVTIRFQSRDVSAIYFEGYSSTSYTRTGGSHDFTATVTYSRELGAMEGSTPLNFILITTDSDGDFSLYMQSDVYLHYKQPFELRQLHAHAYHNMNLDSPN